MTEALAKGGISPDVLAQVVMGGDLSRLGPSEKVSYYTAVCESVGLNPLTQPFDYLKLNGKEVLYAKRACTDQLRSVHGVSVQITERKTEHGIHSVAARATVGGRTDESVGAVCIDGLKGEALANAFMKAETKAKRRVTLSICGLSVLDESELDGLPAQAPAPRKPPRKAPAPPAHDADGVVQAEREPDPWALTQGEPSDGPWTVAELEAASASDVAFSAMIHKHRGWLKSIRQDKDQAAAAFQQAASIAKGLGWDRETLVAEMAAAAESA